MLKNYVYVIAFFLLGISSNAQQEFYLLEQFNGRYDFTFVGNTMNYAENGIGVPCIVQTSSSAQLNLPEGNQIEKVFLYWSGSGTGDFNIKLNNTDIEPERYYSLDYTSSIYNLNFFVAVTEVTEQVLETGNGVYEVSDFDVSENFIPSTQSPYCSTSTNYAGWALVVVYKNDNLPLNQLNLYEGFKNVPEELLITLENLNVIDNQDAKIGFVAWEGDSGISVNETLRINGNVISNPPLNPFNNAFNGTNSITNSSTLYNMDLDIYDIQNNIQIGDTTAEVSLTSGQDLVIISSVVTKLNSQLPDATISIMEVTSSCHSNEIEIFYTVYNINSTEILPENTTISIYINGEFITQTYTQNYIEIGGSESGSLIVNVPDGITDFEVFLVVDEENNVIEILENNNISNILEISLSKNTPLYNFLEDLINCNIGYNTANFDFSDYEYLVKQNPEDEVTFYNSETDAHNQNNPIHIISSYIINEFPKEIFVRIQNEECYSVTSFYLNIKNCPPIIYNAISDNNDGLNDVFHIEGLYDIFENFELFIYSRWGILIWKGNNTTPKWNGKVTEKHAFLDKNAPVGTYFYILYLNDKDYSTPIQGYLYLTR